MGTIVLQPEDFKNKDMWGEVLKLADPHASLDEMDHIQAVTLHVSAADAE